MAQAQEYDVLICGSGSAGLAAATWLARYGVRCKILERRDGPMEMGQADGVQCRTVEIFESLGLSEALLKEAYHVIEVTFWSNHDGKLQRNRRTADTEPGLSHQPHVILNQARINKMLLADMRENNDQVVDYGYEIKSVSVDPALAQDQTAHAVTVVASKNGKEEVFKARYALGCDGAHSAVRKSLGFKMVGDSTNAVWGVMDVYPQTNFPDVRKKCIIHAAAGTLMIIPREGGSLTRYYIEMPAGTIAKNVTLEDLHEAARKIFAPYKMDFGGTYWWSAYSIGQRLADNFHQDYRVFLTGDACHTHSPKAGQGMNVSLQDGYNIGWKLGSFLTGQSTFDLVKTYVMERSMTAANLIQFDREWTSLFAKMHSHDNTVTPEYFAAQFVKNARYTAGLTARYEESEITTYTEQATALATGLSVGMRFPSTQVVRFCDAKAIQLNHAMKADGRWRLVIFAGSLKNAASAARLEKLATYLSSKPGPVSSLAATSPFKPDSFIDPLLVLSNRRPDIEQEEIPDYFWPATGLWAVRDLHKTYVDDESYGGEHGHAYKFYGVDEGKGAIVIVRPDQYVSKILGLDDFKGISDFFDGFALKKNDNNNNNKKKKMMMNGMN